MSKESVSIGTLFIDIGELMNNSWKYYATYLEVLIEKKIIHQIKEFKKKYKNLFFHSIFRDVQSLKFQHLHFLEVSLLEQFL